MLDGDLASRGERRRFEREARAAANVLEGTHAPWGAALAGVLRAGLAVRTNDRTAALAQLDPAIASFDNLDMALYAAAARRWHGELVGGAEGNAEVAREETWMRARGIAKPSSLAAILVPAGR